jgi:hypothetical protein
MGFWVSGWAKLGFLLIHVHILALNCIFPEFSFPNFEVINSLLVNYIVSCILQRFFTYFSKKTLTEVIIMIRHNLELLVPREISLYLKPLQGG